MADKYFTSESMELKRSQIHFASYNPRKISEEGRRQLKRSIKRYGVVGGIVVNKQTGYTLVGGHQKVSILDELNKYPDNDYSLRVELIDVDEKTEKSLNITLNNPNVGGEWDFDAMREIIPDIDYKDAGLTEADLNMIGLDNLLKTEDEANLANSLTNMMQPVTEQKAEEKAQHMKDVKREVKEKSIKDAEDMEAYIMLSFDTYEAKAAFCERFGYAPDMKFIKGETFDEQVERVE